MRTSSFLLAAGLLFASRASAQSENPPLVVQRFEPTPSPTDYLVTFSVPKIAEFGYSLGVFTNLQNDPLAVRFVFPREDGFELGGDAVRVVQNQLVTHLVGAVSLLGWVELGVDLPFYVLQSGEGLSAAGGAGQGVPSGGLGDPRLHVRGRLYETKLGGGELALGGVGSLSLPLGNEGGFMGEAGATFTPRVAASYSLGKVHAAGNFGYRLRPDTTFQTLVLSDELLYSVAGSYDVTPRVAAALELYGASSASRDLRDLDSSPLELDLAGRYGMESGLALTGGAGLGLRAGAGSPDFRVFAGVRYSPGAASGDPDGDGLIGADDQCPRKPETVNGFSDEDGCPDKKPPTAIAGAERITDANDEDADGIPLGVDKCPEQPEDADKYQDDDGCVDPDNDADGILDLNDKCRNEPEDKDGTEDDDGCIDPDNDADGIEDTVDACRDQAEDMDGLADTDGCPDTDADNDGVADESDPCPDKSETFNGLTDDDGCPDEGASSLAFPASGAGAVSGADKIKFQEGKVQLAFESLVVLDELVGRLRAAPTVALVIQVAPDKTKKKSEEKDAQALAKERAAAIFGYLSGFGVEPERLRLVEGGAAGSGVSLTLEAYRAPAP